MEEQDTYNGVIPWFVFACTDAPAPSSSRVMASRPALATRMNLDQTSSTDALTEICGIADRRLIANSLRRQNQ